MAPVDWRLPSDEMPSRTGTAPSIRGLRSSGTTRLGLMLQPLVAVWDSLRANQSVRAENTSFSKC